MTSSARGIPLPLVRANQAVLVAGVALALLSRSPWPLAVLVALLVPGLCLGPRANPVFAAARRLLGRRLQGAPREDAQMQRFNQAIATTLLAGALAAFAAGRPVLGWALAAAVGLAAAGALLGFCVGCFLYLRLRALRARLGQRA